MYASIGPQPDAQLSVLAAVQTGGPDGDLGSNEIKISKDKTIGVVDGSGVLVCATLRGNCQPLKYGRNVTEWLVTNKNAL
jgi:hypothetical protein